MLSSYINFATKVNSLLAFHFCYTLSHSATATISIGSAVTATMLTTMTMTTLSNDYSSNNKNNNNNSNNKNSNNNSSNNSNDNNNDSTNNDTTNNTGVCQKGYKVASPTCYCKCLQLFMQPLQQLFLLLLNSTAVS